MKAGSPRRNQSRKEEITVNIGFTRQVILFLLGISSFKIFKVKKLPLNLIVKRLTARWKILCIFEYIITCVIIENSTLQEAEQRRLEQQDRVNRQQQARAPAPKTLPPQSISPQQPPHPQTTSYLPTYPPQNASPTYSSYPQALKNPSPIQSNNNNNNNMWRNQATTYQPHMPTQAPNGDKALPDSIIHNITQRVNNKNSKNTYSNTNGR